MKNSPLLTRLLDLTLDEDYAMGDLTADALVDEDASGVLRFIAKEDLVLCGRPVLQALAKRFDVHEATWPHAEGLSCEAGTLIATYRGTARDLLAFERPALNFLQRLSGIASATAQFVLEIAGTNAKLLDTRKTLPGHRLLEKYATRIGGAINHRAGLDRGWLIKENHIRQVGSITRAVQLAKDSAVHGLLIEVEVETFSELEEAVVAGADVILLDNFSAVDVREAVQRFGGQVVLEASGGITLESVREYAETGVDLIAVGALTHSACSKDIGAYFVPN